VLPAAAGMHRWVWDLRYPSPQSTTHGYPISAVPHATPQQPQGMLALPGTYKVVLTVDGRRFEAPLTVRPDPRVRTGAEALDAQLHLGLRLAGLLADSSATVMAAESQEAQLKALSPPGAAAQAVQAYRARLASLLGSGEQGEAQPKQPPTNLKEVQEHIAGLYAELQRADAAPTSAQREAAQKLQDSLGPLLGEWQQLKADLPALNRSLRAAHLAPVRADLAPPRDANPADEE